MENNHTLQENKEDGMNSIIRYIVNGKGYGFKFLTLFSVLLALVMGGVT